MTSVRHGGHLEDIELSLWERRQDANRGQTSTYDKKQNPMPSRGANTLARQRATRQEKEGTQQ